MAEARDDENPQVSLASASSTLNFARPNNIPVRGHVHSWNTFATRSLESGMSVKTLSKILGHASVGFTLDVYAHVSEQLKIEEMEKLNVFL